MMRHPSKTVIITKKSRLSLFQRALFFFPFYHSNFDIVSYFRYSDFVFA